MVNVFCTLTGTDPIATIAIITGLSAAVGVLYIVIEGLIGRLTNPDYNPEKEKTEIKSIIAGGVLIVIFMLFLTSFGGAVNSFIDSYNNSVSDKLTNLTAKINNASIALAYATDLSPYSYTQVESFIVKHTYTRDKSFAFLASLVGDINGILSNLYNLWAIKKASLYFLCFAVGVGLKYILPLGVILRFFPPTKKIGSTAIAIAAGVIFFLPISFYLSNEIIEGILPQQQSIEKTNDFLDELKGAAEPAALPFKALISPFAIVPYIINSIGDVAAKITGPIGIAVYTGSMVYTKEAMTAIGTGSNYFLMSSKADLITSGSDALKELADFTILEYLKTSLFLFLTAMSTFVGIRSISLLIGGEFFLYGIQERI
jgi:hypothetical protein